MKSARQVKYYSRRVEQSVFSQPSQHVDYVTASIHDVELGHALIDLSSSLDIIALFILETVGVPKGRITM